MYVNLVCVGCTCCSWTKKDDIFVHCAFGALWDVLKVKHILSPMQFLKKVIVANNKMLLRTDSAKALLNKCCAR